MSWVKDIFCQLPNAVTKHRIKSFRLHQAIQLLVIMTQLSSSKQLRCIALHCSRNSNDNSSSTFMHPNELVVPGGLCVAQYKGSERR